MTFFIPPTISESEAEIFDVFFTFDRNGKRGSSEVQFRPVCCKKFGKTFELY